jgi:hypothetical protein
MREIEIVNSGTKEFPFYQVMKQGVEFCSTNSEDNANEIVRLLEVLPVSPQENIRDIPFPTWEEATKGITDSRFTLNGLGLENTKAGARIMYDRLYSMIDEYLASRPSNEVTGEMIEKYEPYFGWCDVSRCNNEGCSGGIAWKESGYWTVCTEHSRAHREGKPQPKMKASAIKREKSRDKVTGYLPISTSMIEDGFGSVWSAYCPECGKKSMQVMRPGKVQCKNCG